MRPFVLSLALGLLLTVGSLLVSQELHPTSAPVPDGFAGDARVMGAPWPYAYVLTSDVHQETMRLEAHCYITPFCWDYAGRNPQDGAFSLPPFLGDLIVWTAAVAVIARLRAGRIPGVLGQKPSATA